MDTAMEHDFTEEQLECIQQLRVRMKDLMPQHFYEDNYLFLRFLKARDYDLEAAEAMLKKSMEWKKNNNIETLLTWFKIPEVAEKYFSVNTLGFSKDDWTVLYSAFGKIDFRGYLKSVNKTDAYMFIVYKVERVLQMARERFMLTGKRRDQLILVVDLENFSFATATNKAILDFAVQVIHTVDNNYPEVLHAAIVINENKLALFYMVTKSNVALFAVIGNISPPMAGPKFVSGKTPSFFFTLFWSVVSPFLAKATLSKFRIYGKEGWQSELSKFVQPEILPVILGGTLTGPDGDPMCKNTINYGGPIPQSYYIQKDERFRNNSDTKKCHVYPLSKKTVEVTVKELEAFLEWEFEVKSRDIDFSVQYEDFNGSITKEIIPHQRIDALVGPEKGMIKCNKAGTYILEFDNTYSWMFSKDIYYTVLVQKPDEPTSKR